MDKPVRQTTSYKEALIGNTLYRVTSVFTGEKDLVRPDRALNKVA